MNYDDIVVIGDEEVEHVDDQGDENHIIIEMEFRIRDQKLDKLLSHHMVPVTRR